MAARRPAPTRSSPPESAGVHVAMLDPNPLVSGRGVEQPCARRASRSTVGDGEAESARLLEAYVKHTRHGMPFVVAKFAATLDGKIAASSGDSRWVAGDEARAWAHALPYARSTRSCAASTTCCLTIPQLTARPGGVARSANRCASSPTRAAARRSTRRCSAPAARTLIATTRASPVRMARSRRSRRRGGLRAARRCSGSRGHARAACACSASAASCRCWSRAAACCTAASSRPSLSTKCTRSSRRRSSAGATTRRSPASAPRVWPNAVTLRDVEVLRLGADVAFVGLRVTARLDCGLHPRALAGCVFVSYRQPID